MSDEPVLPTRRDCYARPRSFEVKAATIRLRDGEWELLLALDGRRSIEELARSVGLEVDETIALIARFERMGLAETRQSTLPEYLAAKGAPLTVPMVREHVAEEPQPTASAASLQPAPPAEAATPRVKFSLRRGESTEG